MDEPCDYCDKPAESYGEMACECCGEAVPGTRKNLCFSDACCDAYAAEIARVMASGTTDHSE